MARSYREPFIRRVSSIFVWLFPLLCSLQWAAAGLKLSRSSSGEELRVTYSAFFPEFFHRRRDLLEKSGPPYRSCVKPKDALRKIFDVVTLSRKKKKKVKKEKYQEHRESHRKLVRRECKDVDDVNVSTWLSRANPISRLFQRKISVTSMARRLWPGLLHSIDLSAINRVTVS